MDTFVSARIPIDSMLVDSSKDADTADEHAVTGKAVSESKDGNGVSKETDSTQILADADELFSVFQQKLKSVVSLDHLSNTSINDLKLLNDEFQLLNTTNGVYAESKLVESLKTDIHTLNNESPILEKINKRHKQLVNESDNLDNLKTELLNHLVDTQTEREHLLHAQKNPENPMDKDKNSYLSTYKTTYINPLSDESAQLQATADEHTKNGDGASGPPVVKKKSNRGGRRVKGVTNAELLAHPELYEKKTPARKRPSRAKTSSNLKTEITAEGTTSSNGLGKRKRKPVSRNDEIVGDSNIEQSLSEALVDEPNKKRKIADGEADGNSDEENEEGQEALAQNGPKLTVREIKGLEKQYDNTYISIWKDLARKDNPKAYRLFQQSSQAKSINYRKTAQLAVRESKKWQLKTTKSQRDQLSKARRAMREMLSFWKKNEKEERALRLKAEQEALQRAKKDEEEREAKRQARKLNFLINQTELYSHFIGKKIKTGEFEGEMGDKTHPGNAKSNISPDAENVDLSMATKDFNNLDFDEENEDNLNKMAAANAQSALNEAKEKAQQFNQGVKRAGDSDDEENEGEMNFQNPTSIGNITVEQPKLLNCTLKEYQRKGLNWLANLYEQGINGILADEMGLGKTVQSISVLSYLAETHDIWGPFLVVTPASTLHNWQQEITRFVPDFNVLPYWGTSKDRKVLRKFWDRKNIIYNRNSPFHVVVTSYQLVVTDCAFFQKMKWQYMILDEAQAIKSSQSSRWKSLLSFQCRNRLLLTGTPIQNNMQELWALLHFIMPSLFDSHDEFSEWFSKDIEAHAQSNSKLNEEQLRRLHAILKPFMLRRIKKNVQSELGEKIEVDVYCDLTNRQKKLYRMLRSQINVVDLIENNKRIGNNEEVESLMNVVMQFRKVCNHPDLFERADTQSAFLFGDFPKTESLLREVNETTLEINYNTKNHIEYTLPKTILNELLLPSSKGNNLTDKEILIKKMFNIYDAKNYHNNSESELSILRLVNETPNEIERIVSNHLVINAINNRSYVSNSKDDLIRVYKEVYNKDKDNTLVISKNQISSLYTNEIDKASKDMYMRVLEKGYFHNAVAPPIEIVCSKSNFNYLKEDILFNPLIRQALLPLELNTQARLLEHNIPVQDWPKAEMLPVEESNYFNGGTIRLPSMERFVLESAKLRKLDQMLVDLKKGGHKCLIYFQMTRMMDLMEEYLGYRQYKYIRLDGSSRLSDRRDLVNDWQTNPELFIFLLSTRAGGLGINLTAADTVIFYDSDWNPTIDSQAMDRAHRLGQQRQVTVYRLLVRGTIEERMRDRAKQKEHVQQVVMEGKVEEVKENKENEKERDKKEMALWLLDDDK